LPLPILSLPPDQAQYAGAFGKTSIATQLDGGASRFRNDQLGAAFLVDVQWTTSAANYNYLTAFYRTSVTYGADPFQIDLLLDAGDSMLTYTAHFVPGTFKLILQAGETFIVAAQLEVVPDPAYSAGDTSIPGVTAPVIAPPITGGGTGVVVTPPTPSPNTVTAYSLVSNVVTFTGVFPTPYPVGRDILISNTGSFLDGKVVTTLATPSGTSFTANYTHANASASGLNGKAALQPVLTPTLDDMLTWMLLLNRTTQHLEGGSGPTLVTAYHWKDADTQKIWLIKSLGPPPWAADINYYDNARIYHYITENADLNDPGDPGVSHWSDNNAWKRNYPLLPVLPRYFDPNGSPVTITAGGTNPFVRTLNHEADGEPLLFLGQVTNVLLPQVSRAFGADVGTALTLRNDFFYGKQREQFYYVKNLGLVEWTHAKLTSGPTLTGTYTIDQDKLHNRIVSGGCPTPVFPGYASIPGPGFGGAWIGGVPGAGANIP
jgi:hypothetical protein